MSQQSPPVTLKIGRDDATGALVDTMYGNKFGAEVQTDATATSANTATYSYYSP